ncbi:MAG TPA: acyl-ACP--UDP-N-acetylglucosamine O-acyltransferase [Candidatus Limnocylindria bacterium]|nr:acyl-ACP--UDP-N-acetylglucosamine O-acyltransferase [Candidatus Limnocylindria bacterium]
MRSGVGYPLVDRVLDLEPGRRGRARKVVSANEPYFAGHFPGIPVMPGVLLCAALTELAALVVDEDGDGPPPALREMPHARFRHPVFPGDALELSVECEPGPPWRCRGTGTVDGRVVVEAELVLDASDEPYIHPTAIVARGAELARGVRIGPYAVIGPQVRLGERTWVGAHAVVRGRTTLGPDNRVFPFASLGGPPQDLKYRGEPSRLEIGANNAIREYVTMNPGTEAGGMLTRVGNGSLFMANAHVGHDCVVGDAVVLANSAALAGHVVVEAHAIIGGLAGVHQFTRVGESAMCGAGAMVSQDVPPFCTASGDRARLYGLNLIGLKRRGFPDATVRALKRAYRTLFLAGQPLEQALARARAEAGEVPEVVQLVAFVEGSARGVCRP